MYEAHRSFRATTQKRRKFVPRASLTMLGTPDALGQRSGVVQDRLGTGLGMLLGGARALLACPGRPKIGPRAFFWRPSPFWSASWRVPQMALSAQERPRPKENFTIFSAIFVDFSSIFARFWLCPARLSSQLVIEHAIRSESQNEAAHTYAPASIEHSFEHNIVRTCKPHLVSIIQNTM